MTARVDHLTVTVADLAAGLAFYDRALAPLGLVRLHELVDEEEEGAAVEAVAFGAPDGAAVLWLVGGAAATTGLHLALRTGRREEVESFHAAAVAAGGTSHDAPRRWPIYRRGEFNAIVADPAGNLVEVVSAE